MTGGSVWRRRLAIGAVVVITLAVLAVLRNPGDPSPFSPDSTKPSGSAAVASLLRHHHVSIQATSSLLDARSEGRGSSDARTVLILPSNAIDEAGWRQIADALPAHTVLVKPSGAALSALVPEVVAGSSASTGLSEPRQAGCGLRAATQAGTVESRGRLYNAAATSSNAATSSTTGIERCFGDGQNHGLIRVTRGDRTIDVLGLSDVLQNSGLTRAGNAALALDLLGAQSRLTWIDPDPASVQTPTRELTWPQLRFAAWMSAVAVLVLAIAVSRRLGPVVAERLPVVVRATETTLGRARLYRRFGAYDSAAAALRSSARRRLIRRLHIASDADPGTVIGAVVAASGAAAAGVHHLLYGPVPTSEAELLDLAAGLAALTEEVSRP